MGGSCSLTDRRSSGDTAVPSHLTTIWHGDSNSTFSQGEDGPPGNGTEGFPGFPVSIRDMSTKPPLVTLGPSWISRWLGYTKAISYSGHLNLGLCQPWAHLTVVLTWLPSPTELGITILSFFAGVSRQQRPSWAKCEYPYRASDRSCM